MDFTKAEADVCYQRRFAERCYPCEGNPQEGIFLNACTCALRHILHFSLDINTACVVRLVCTSAPRKGQKCHTLVRVQAAKEDTQLLSFS